LLLKVGNKWNLFGALIIEIGLVEDIKLWNQPLLRGARTRFRWPRLKIFIRVKACFKQASLGLSIHILTLKIGPKDGVLPEDPYSPT
jgi:hypothetical protein